MKNSKKVEYFYLKKLGIKINYDSQIPYVKWKDLDEGLKKNKIDQKLFDKYFGIQTCDIRGGYVYDIEAVLVRIFENRLISSQLFWD